jgi:hypothetical protein
MRLSTRRIHQNGRPAASEDLRQKNTGTRLDAMSAVDLVQMF